MKELELAKQILKEAETYGRVRSLKLEVGQISGININNLKDAFDEISDSEVSIVLKKPSASCECGFSGEPETYPEVKCPECNSPNLNILEGNSYHLKEIVVSSDRNL